MQTEMPRRMLRVGDVAALTSLSTSYLNKLRVTGLGPPFRKIGRAVLYDPDDVQTWLDRHGRGSTSDQGR
jgi:predicted DNA-binding transcriptional regulator AlpA